MLIPRRRAATRTHGVCLEAGEARPGASKSLLLARRLRAAPRIDRDQTERLIPVKGSPPSLINIPDGCAFNPRCPYADVPKDNVTRTVRPELAEVGSRHWAACHMTQEQRERIWTEEIAPKL